MNRIKPLILILTFLFTAQLALGQGRINPSIANFGGIFDAPYATEKPDPNQQYKIVIDIATNDGDPDEIAYSLYNVARLMNLHVMGGVPKENMHVVLAIHGGAAYSVMNNEEYKKKYDVDSPYLELFEELEEAGVQMFACSQSLKGRGIDHEKMVPQISVATSMLTVMTTYQLKGYAALKF
ncbi:MAG: DsrE family protein [Roseivirga sp.]|nr:DsrE family protein [Roseivirga sp.]